MEDAIFEREREWVGSKVGFIIWKGFMQTDKMSVRISLSIIIVVLSSSL